MDKFSRLVKIVWGLEKSREKQIMIYHKYSEYRLDFLYYNDYYPQVVEKNIYDFIKVLNMKIG